MKTKALRTAELKLIISHGISVRQFDEMKAKRRINKNKQHNLIYLDGYIAKNKQRC